MLGSKACPDSNPLRLFLDHFSISDGPPSVPHLLEVATAFSRLPYENLTKIIKHAREGSPERSRRSPLEVISDHVNLGAGGTCFSLTATLLHLLRSLGWRAEPILADRHYGTNTHCALLVWIGEAPHLLDPGYLIVNPIALSPLDEIRIPTAFNEVILTPTRSGEKLMLSTVQEGNRSSRLTFRITPADPGEFLRAWDESFGWDMMHYPLLTRVEGNSQVYLRNLGLQVRTRTGATRREIDPEQLPARIAREFGLRPSLAHRALKILKRHGELHGSTRTT